MIDAKLTLEQARVLIPMIPVGIDEAVMIREYLASRPLGEALTAFLAIDKAIDRAYESAMARPGPQRLGSDTGKTSQRQEWPDELAPEGGGHPV